MAHSALPTFINNWTTEYIEEVFGDSIASAGSAIIIIIVIIVIGIAAYFAYTTLAAPPKTSKTGATTSTVPPNHVISVSGSSAVIGTNFSMVDVSVFNNASTPTTIYRILINGSGRAGPVSLLLAANQRNNTLRPTQLPANTTGFIMTPHSDTTFMLENYASLPLVPNYTYAVQVIGSGGAYAASKLVVQGAASSPRTKRNVTGSNYTSPGIITISNIDVYTDYTGPQNVSGVNCESYNKKGVVSGSTQYFAGSAQKMSFTFYTYGCPGTVTGVQITTPGFAVANTSPSLPMYLPADSTEYVQINYLTPSENYSGPLSVVFQEN